MAYQFFKQILDAIHHKIAVVTIFEAKIEHQLIVTLIQHLYSRQFTIGGKFTKPYVIYIFQEQSPNACSTYDREEL